MSSNRKLQEKRVCLKSYNFTLQSRRQKKSIDSQIWTCNHLITRQPSNQKKNIKIFTSAKTIWFRIKAAILHFEQITDLLLIELQKTFNRVSLMAVTNNVLIEQSRMAHSQAVCFFFFLIPDNLAIKISIFMCTSTLIRVRYVWRWLRKHWK